MIFDENTSGLGLLKSSYGSSCSDLFGIVEDTESIVPFMSTSTNSSTSVSESTGSQSTLTETVTSPDRSYEGNGNSLTPCLARRVVKMIDVVGPDVGNIYTSQ